MKKLLIGLILFMVSSIALSQSLTLKQMLFIAQNGNVDTELTKLGFTKGKDLLGLKAYMINPGTDQDERFRYDPRGSSYQTYNSVYIKALEEQAKKQYKLILRDDREDEIYCEYGTPELRVIFSLSKKATHFSHIDFIKH